jgi:preprotein translocase subunit SecF
MQFKPIREWNIIGKSKLWFALSLTIIFIGVFSLIFNDVKIKAPLNFGIDFTGGVKMSLDFEKDTDVAQLRTILTKYNLGNAVIQLEQSNKKHAIIKLEPTETTVIDKIVNDMEAKFGKINTDTQSIESIGPTIGSELKRNAILTISIALLLIFLYIVIRFRTSYAIATILALLHDVVITVGVLALTRIQLNFPSVAALLSVTAYSVQDSIIILDRLRENLKYKKDKQTFAEIANISVTETWTRSFNTSFTTLIAVIVLAFFGGSSIRDFTTILLVGITAGTYSSIYVVVPLLVLWRKKEERVIKTTKVEPTFVANVDKRSEKDKRQSEITKKVFINNNTVVAKSGKTEDTVGKKKSSKRRRR